MNLLDRVHLSLRLDLLQALWELLPVVHDDISLALLGEDLGHLVHLLLAVLDAVDANLVTLIWNLDGRQLNTYVADERNTSTHSRSSSALAVLHGNAVFRLHAELLACVEVDLGVGLAGRRVQASSRTVDVLVGEVLHLIGLDQAGDNTRLGAGADDAHGVALLLEALELLGRTWARLSLLAELPRDAVELLADVALQFSVRQCEVVLLLKAHAHAAEVLADEVLEESIGGIALGEALLLHNLVGQVGAGLEGETL